MWTWKIKYHGIENLLRLEIGKADLEEQIHWEQFGSSNSGQIWTYCFSCKEKKEENDNSWFQ